MTHVCRCRHAVAVGSISNSGLGSGRRRRWLMARTQPTQPLGGTHELPQEVCELEVCSA